jgi:hypothetical protein
MVSCGASFRRKVPTSRRGFKETIVSLQNLQRGFGSRQGATSVTALAALLGIVAAGYLVAAPAQRADAPAPVTLDHSRIAPSAESVDNARECDPEAGVRTHCIYQ